jgi:hypothetical protein
MIRPVDRRDFLVQMIQALLLALFPWLRTERGQQVAKEGAEQLATDWKFSDGEIRWELREGMWEQQAIRQMALAYNFQWNERSRELLRSS